MCLHNELHFRIIFWVASISLLLLAVLSTALSVRGFMARARYTEYKDFTDTQVQTMVRVTIGLSLLTLVAVITALISIALDWYPLLIAHTIAFCLISFLLLGVGLWFMMLARDVHTEASLSFRMVAELEALISKPDFIPYNNSILAPVQRDMECCGVYDYNDYFRALTKQWMKDILPVPKSCCVNPETTCLTNTQDHHQEGCLTKLAVHTTTTFSNFGVIMYSMCLTMLIDAALLFVLSFRAKDFFYFYPYYL